MPAAAFTAAPAPTLTIRPPDRSRCGAAARQALAQVLTLSAHIRSQVAGSPCAIVFPGKSTGDVDEAIQPPK